MANEKARKAFEAAEKATSFYVEERKNARVAANRLLVGEREPHHYKAVRKRYWNDCPVCGLPWLHRFQSTAPCPDCKDVKQ